MVLGFEIFSAKNPKKEKDKKYMKYRKKGEGDLASCERILANFAPTFSIFLWVGLSIILEHSEYILFSAIACL